MAGVTSTHALPQALVPLAQELDDNKVTPGLLGFVIFAVIALALWALMKNMGKQMKKIDFEENPADQPPRAGGASAPAQRTSTPAGDASAKAGGSGGSSGSGKAAAAGTSATSASAAKPKATKSAKAAKPAAGPVKTPRPAPGK